MKPVIRVPSDALLAHFYQEELDPNSALSSQDWEEFLIAEEMTYVKLCKAIAKALLKVHLASRNS